MNRTDIQAVFKQHWKPGWGSIAPDEVEFVSGLIERYRPGHFLEIGMASGLSGGLICSIMERHGGRRFTSVDHDNTFFGDNTKENGFLIEKIYQPGVHGGCAVEVVKRPHTTALDLDEIGETFDMAFVDANHQHPWPLVDTLCIFPHLRGSRVMIHHDLTLFRRQKVLFGIGPKYLFDQFPPTHRVTSDANGGNIFALTFVMDTERLITIAADAFQLPWSLRTEMRPGDRERVAAMLERHYGQFLADLFTECAERFNASDRFRSGL